MGERTFPLVPVSRAEHGPKALGARIVCCRCRATDEIVLGARSPGPWIAKRFAAGGWAVDRREGDDLCPNCGPRKPRKELPMVATKPAASTGRISEEAIIARKVVHDLLFENLDIPAERYRDGWSDERVAAEAKMSAKFVAEFREKLFFKLAADPETTRRSATLAELGRLAGELDEALGAIGAARAALETSEAAARRLVGRIGESLGSLEAGARR